MCFAGLTVVRDCELVWLDTSPTRSARLALCAFEEEHIQAHLRTLTCTPTLQPSTTACVSPSAATSAATSAESWSEAAALLMRQHAIVK